ncbi:DNA cytosine methyltransferase [Arthrobacter halodurans]|uniref:DNA (cytosine-5-)-methyltransferase n=1 Tax=Arthrobacter halodurans TaxID=516699 RepID=A0ABV4UV82_9MICC
MIPVIDVFAGPGGLNEGFSSVLDETGNHIFRTVASIEMEKSAVRTLRFRSAMRHYRRTVAGSQSALNDFLANRSSLHELMENEDFKLSHKHAAREVHEFELGPDNRPDSDAIISEALGAAREQPWVLIGGPPCQAYSLAGRSRRTHDEAFQDDHKHFLYREYLHIIRAHKPTVFVMENVKGLLSSTNRGQNMFDLIRGDLEKPSDDLEYELYSMVKSDLARLQGQDFLIRAEDYGVPQKRHRVIIVGVRRGSGLSAPAVLEQRDRVSVGQAISDLPKLRSSVSRGIDAHGDLWATLSDSVRTLLAAQDIRFEASGPWPTSSKERPKAQYDVENASLREYFSFVRPILVKDLPTWNHESRGHMTKDLLRYGVMSGMSKERGRSVKVRELDRSLWPAHKNIDALVVPFADRFRVQVANEPSTTIVSHIAKDGHYYIHPDPAQMRSLTVREAARLQTFPDDYIFLGNRTQQFTQVGNAVPPLLAKLIGERIATIMRY